MVDNPKDTKSETAAPGESGKEVSGSPKGAARTRLATVPVSLLDEMIEAMLNLAPAWRERGHFGEGLVGSEGCHCTVCKIIAAKGGAA